MDLKLLIVNFQIIVLVRQLASQRAFTKVSQKEPIKLELIRLVNQITLVMDSSQKLLVIDFSQKGLFMVNQCLVTIIIQVIILRFLIMVVMFQKLQAIHINFIIKDLNNQVD